MRSAVALITAALTCGAAAGAAAQGTPALQLTLEEALSKAVETSHRLAEARARESAAEANVALLGKLPLDTRIRAESDAGRPTVLAAPDSPRGRAWIELARHTAGVLARRPRDRGGAFPNIVVERAS